MDIEYIKFLARNQIEFLELKIKSPFSINWGNSIDELKKNKEDILTILHYKYHDLIELNLLSYLLKSNFENKDINLINNIIKSNNVKKLILANISRDFISNIKQITFYPAIFLNSFRKSIIIYFIYITFSENFNFSFLRDCIWLKEVNDKKFKDSFKDVIKALSINDNFYIFPLVNLCEIYNFEGRSSSLPLAINIIKPQYFQENKVIASGCVTSTGKIEQPKFLKEKVSHCIDKNKFDLFITSLQSDIIDNIDSVKKNKKIEIISIQNIDDLKILLNTNPKQYSYYNYAINDINYLLNNIQDIDEFVLIKILNIKFSEIKDFLKSDVKYLALFSDKVQKLLDERQLNKLSYISSLVDGILFFQETLQKDLLYGFNLSSAFISFYNHTGDFYKSDEIWNFLTSSSDNKSYLQQMEHAGYDSEVYRLINRSFITQHNKFNFSTELQQLKKIIEFAEKKLKIVNNRPCSELAKIYGTIAQHYAFCQKFIDFLNFFKKACFFFGNGNINNHEMISGYLRQYSYLFFAMLDCNKVKCAEKALLKFLKLEDKIKTISDIDEKDIDVFLSKNTKFEIFAIIRFISENTSPFIDINNKIYRKIIDFFNMNKVQNEHPYQLLFYNLGKIEFKRKNYTNSKKFMLNSIEICNNINTPTLHVMKLLPISFLYNNKDFIKLTKFELDFINETNSIIKIITSTNISKSHFENILKFDNYNKVLEEIYLHTKKYFPFTYR